MSYEFQSTLHRTSANMHAHMAESYMYAGGLNDDDHVRRFFADNSLADLADEAIKQWDLASNADFSRDEFIAALKDLRDATAACPECDGTGTLYFSEGRFDSVLHCETCGGSGTQQKQHD